jgi:MoxR-like ATPase
LTTLRPFVRLRRYQIDVRFHHQAGTDPMMNSTQAIRTIQDNISRVIKGKPLVIEMTVVALLARGHLLLEDVPGVGKTTLAHSLARSLDCSFKRIQFTSDLLPSDIVGVSIFNRQKQAFEFMPGPIFANIVLADEINRTTPKTQSSLLEAMSEAQISVDNQTYPLSQPFMVIATQNPSEYHGTFPLPESQLDRFLMRLRIGYPSPEEERKVLDRAPSLHPAEELQAVLTAQDVLDLQAQVDKVFVDESLTEYLLSIVQATRQSELLSLGVSTRGALALSRTAKALALVRGRTYCLPDDIKELAPTVLSHRIMVARSQGIRQRSFEQAERIIQDLVESIPVPV